MPKAVRSSATTTVQFCFLTLPKIYNAVSNQVVMRIIIPLLVREGRENDEKSFFAQLYVFANSTHCRVLSISRGKGGVRMVHGVRTVFVCPFF